MKSKKSKKPETGFKTIEELRSYLGSLPEVGSGGCGISAYFMYEWLKGHGKDPEICFIYPDADWENYRRENESALKGLGKACAPSHCVIHNDGKYFDCQKSVPDQVFKAFSQQISVQKVSEEFLLEALENTSTWADAFNRAKYVPMIEKRTGIKLKHAVPQMAMAA